jgi:N-acetylmuramoyl-L-alanine amidase CwlA
MLTKEQWLKRKRRKRSLRLVVLTTVVMLIILSAAYIGLSVLRFHSPMLTGIFQKKITLDSPLILKDLLTPNDYSRPQTPLTKVNSIVIHYTANPGTSAEANRNYFENLKTTKTTSASSHYIIGLEGEIIQCIPLNEIAFASNDRNSDTISIESCHPDKTGKFNEYTYQSLVQLTAWLCAEYDLKREDIIRHYDVSGKHCPIYYVDHEDAWEQFKDDVMTYMKENAIE